MQIELKKGSGHLHARLAPKDMSTFLGGILGAHVLHLRTKRRFYLPEAFSALALHRLKRTAERQTQH